MLSWSLIFLALLLEFYFAGVLGVSALAKAARPNSFAIALRGYGFFPTWSVGLLTIAVPVVEMITSVLLVVGANPFFTSILVIALFSIFYMLHIVTMVTGKRKGCGCYGTFYQEKENRVTLVVVSIQLGLAILHLYLVRSGFSVPLTVRLPLLIGFSGLLLWLSASVVQRRLQARSAPEGLAYFPRRVRR